MLVRVTGLGDRIEGLRGGEGNEKSLSSLYTSRERPARVFVRRYTAPTMLMVALTIGKAVFEASGIGAELVVPPLGFML